MSAVDVSISSLSRSFERDRERQNMLVIRGWIVLRFILGAPAKHAGQLMGPAMLQPYCQSAN
mgnify:CR=1 FL=1